MARRARGSGCRYALIALGVAPVLFVLAAFTPAGRGLIELMFQLWYVGVASAVGALMLHRRRAWPTAAGLLAFVGITWILVLAAWTVTAAVFLFVSRPFGP